MTNGLGFEMSGDHILTAARDLLANMPSVEELDREVAEQLRLAEETYVQLRADIRTLIRDYRAWRREARCGSAATAMQPANLPMLKQIRAGLATYRLTQILLRDIRAMAMMDAALPVSKFKKIASMPTIKPVSEMPTPANEPTPVDSDKDPIDGLLYEELELKYGPSVAQKLYDELKKAEELNRHSAKPN